MSAHRWPTDRSTLPGRPALPSWSSTLSVLLWGLCAAFVLGVAIPALWIGR